MDRYYYDNRRLDRRLRQRGALFKYIFPFLFLVVFGVAIVLGVQVYKFFYVGAVKSYASMYIVSGQAQIKMWGNDSFSKAYSGMNILQGDEVSIVRDSSAVIKFFDDTLLRISGGSDIVFEEIVGTGSGDKIKIVLKSGEVWVNRTTVAATDTDFSVLAGFVSVEPTSAIFDVKGDGVFVISGSVIVDVYNKEMVATVDEFTIKTDQSALFDEEKFSRFWGFQSPNIVTDGLSDDFKNSLWFAWNMKEDNEPTDFANGKVPKEEAAVGEAAVAGDVVDDGVAGDSVSKELETADTVSTNLDFGVFSDPKILKINGEVWDQSMFEKGVTVKAFPVRVEGVVTGAKSVIVDGYTLQKFIPREGESSFVYSLKPEFGNLKPGENIYEVYAVSPDGLKSAVVKFKVMYAPDGVEI